MKVLKGLLVIMLVFGTLAACSNNADSGNQNSNNKKGNKATTVTAWHGAGGEGAKF